MKGKVFGQKKSIILIATAFVMFFFFILSTILAFFVLKSPVLWFFNFCITLGFFEIMRAILFCVDDATYLGSLLSSLGLTGYLETYLPVSQFVVSITLSCFVVASIITFFFFRQNFQLVLAFFFTFVIIFTFLHAKNLISFGISIAFIMCFLVIFIVNTLLSIKWRK